MTGSTAVNSFAAGRFTFVKLAADSIAADSIAADSIAVGTIADGAADAASVAATFCSTADDFFDLRTYGDSLGQRFR